MKVTKTQNKIKCPWYEATHFDVLKAVGAKIRHIHRIVEKDQLVVRLEDGYEYTTAPCDDRFHKVDGETVNIEMSSENATKLSFILGKFSSFNDESMKPILASKDDYEPNLFDLLSKVELVDFANSRTYKIEAMKSGSLFMTKKETNV